MPVGFSSGSTREFPSLSIVAPPPGTGGIWPGSRTRASLFPSPAMLNRERRWSPETGGGPVSGRCGFGTQALHPERWSCPGLRLELLPGRYRDMRRESLVRIVATEEGSGSGAPPSARVRQALRGWMGRCWSSRRRSSPTGGPAAVMSTIGADNVRIEPVPEFRPSLKPAGGVHGHLPERRGGGHVLGGD